MNTRIDRNSVVFCAAALVTLLILVHLGGYVWQVVLGKESGQALIRLIDLNQEANIPTWFSSTLLSLCGFLLALIGMSHRSKGEPYALHWMFLAAIFVFLSCDETAQIHEWTVAHVHRIVNTEFTRFIGWVIPYAILLIVLGFSYLRFFFQLPNRVKVLFAGAGCLYVGGALGMELLTAAIGRVVFDGKLHFVFGILEELLEMGGVVFFIYALLSYLAWHVGEIQVRFEASESG